MGLFRRLLKPAHPKASGGYDLGCIRARLTAAEGHEGATVFAQVYYPADADLPLLPLPEGSWFRPEAVEGLSKSYGIPLCVLRSLFSGEPMLEPARAPLKSPDASGWPVVVFSCGLSGSCEIYSQFCREMASVGTVVVATEPEDGSAVFARSGSTGEVLQYQRLPWGVSKEAEIRRRSPWLARRRAEMDATLACLRNSAAGAAPPGASPEAAALHSVLRNVDCKRALLVGHSFGASSAIDYLQRAAREGRKPFAGAILADPWSEPLPHEDLLRPLGVRFQVVISEQWHGPKVRHFVGAHQGELLGFEVVKGTHHQWISELAFMFPERLARCLRLSGSCGHAEGFARTTPIVFGAMRRLLSMGDGSVPLRDGGEKSCL